MGWAELSQKPTLFVSIPYDVFLGYPTDCARMIF